MKCTILKIFEKHFQSKERKFVIRHLTAIRFTLLCMKHMEFCAEITAVLRDARPTHKKGAVTNSKPAKFVHDSQIMSLQIPELVCPWCMH
jgi:hypothetical protein